MATNARNSPSLPRPLAAVRRPWRVVPALDSLSDDDGRLLVQRLASLPSRPFHARRRILFAMTFGTTLGFTAGGGIPATIGLPVLVALFGAFVLVSHRSASGRLATTLLLVLGIVAGAAAVIWRATHPGPVVGPPLGLILIPAMALVMAAGMAFTAVTWWIVAAVTLNHRVSARLRDDWCQGCAYPIHDLPRTDEPLECPSCGRPCIARESIRSAAQLLACDVEAHAAAIARRARAVEACACGYPLRGLPSTDGLVRCPECGRGYREHRNRFVVVEEPPSREGVVS